MNETLKKAFEAIENKKERSAWGKGVKAYALDMIEELDEAIDYGDIDAEILTDRKEIEETLLNGAKDWVHYSWGGSALICNYDIAGRLCSPSELKKTNHGRKNPNAREEWLDVQARALYQAAKLVKDAITTA